MKKIEKTVMCMVLALCLVCTQLIAISAEDWVECDIKYPKSAKEFIKKMTENKEDIQSADSFGITVVATTSDYDNLKVCGVSVMGR